MRRILGIAVVIGLALSTGILAQNRGNRLRGGDRDGDGRCDVCGQAIGQRQCPGKGGQGRGHGAQRLGRRMMNWQQAPAPQQK